MSDLSFFCILDSVDSTNNYAMAQVQAGEAADGSCWFSKEQYAGKGQRGKKWSAMKGENITMSIALKPTPALIANPFLLSALVSDCCAKYLQGYLGDEKVSIKWPNDLYIGDKKTGGILIETAYSGKKWTWAIIGIGININQISFDKTLDNPTSLSHFTGTSYDVEELGKQLYVEIIKAIAQFDADKKLDLMNAYNGKLYCAGEEVKLKKDNVVFKTRVKKVSEFGVLITGDTMERHFNFGEISWVLKPGTSIN